MYQTHTLTVGTSLACKNKITKSLRPLVIKQKHHSYATNNIAYFLDLFALRSLRFNSRIANRTDR